MKYVNAFHDRDTNQVHLLYRNEDGLLCKHTHEGEHVVYTRDGDGFRREFGVRSYHARKSLCLRYKQGRVDTFEGDVDPLRRWISDNGITVGRPRRVYIDIETDSRVSFDDAKAGNAQVLCIGLVDDDGLTTPLLAGDEACMLDAFWSFLVDYDQVVAWNSPMGNGTFDFEVLINRSARLGVKHPDVRRWLWLDHCAVYRRYNTGSSASGEEKVSYKLDHVSRYLGLAGKLDVDASKAWELYQTDPKALLNYCMNDAQLLSKIEEKTGYIEMFQTICEECYCFPETRSLLPTVLGDGLILRLGAERGVHFPTREFEEKTYTDVPGAYVEHPTPGIHEDVHVCDFSGMYPSIIQTWNISPDTLTTDADEPHCTSDADVMFRTDKVGIFPEAIGRVGALRDKWKAAYKAAEPGSAAAREAECRSAGYKTIINSFYGILLSPYSRYYSEALGRSVTLTGQMLLKETMQAGRNSGWGIVYGDTDSSYNTGKSKADFDEFIFHCNTGIYPHIARQAGCTASYIKLSYDKSYERIVFVSAKRYVGVIKGKALPDVKGLEIKRGDTHLLARLLQQRVVDLFVIGCKDPGVYRAKVEEAQQYVLHTKQPAAHVILSKSLSKPIDEYAGNVPQVRVAKVLRERGENVAVGTRISYVVVNGEKTLEVIPASDFDGTYDRYYLWKMVYEPSMRLLQAMFPDEDWHVWLNVRPKKPRKKKVKDEQAGDTLSLELHPRST